MTTEKPKVALALYVKSEFSDIAGWVAWHAALGIQRFYIYEDGSTDGTWEILEAASEIYDIQIEQTDTISEPDFYYRQRNSYIDAIRRSAEDGFDWIGLLDGDEYVYLCEDDNISDFFQKFDHADAVAFSWRIYGSSGRIVRPHQIAVEAYTRHSTPAFGDNLHIKSFVRPGKTGNHYHNPHWFDVPAEKYARPSGEMVDRSGAGQSIQWSHAFIMHFVCRSMEHYIARIKRRKNFDIGESLDNWTRFDLNEAEDNLPLRLIPRAKSHLCKIHDQMVEKAIRILRTKVWKGTDYGTKIIDTKYDRYEIQSFFETKLCVAKFKNIVCHAFDEVIDNNNYKPIIGTVIPETPEIITLSCEGEEYLDINFDKRLSKNCIYRISFLSNKKIALQIPSNNMYMAFLMPDNGEAGVDANRRAADNWENVFLIPVDDYSDSRGPSSTDLVITSKSTAEDFQKWIAQGDTPPSKERFLRALYALDSPVRDQILRLVPGLLWHMEYN
ncbi:glycosyltransferase family 2 protein [Gluconobacter cerinus]|uniref:glycosyltransferase family 2 protein n=1 Tax=Gluconobacter cerinus TaxID=38307 RepID=UPI001B8BB211|nr:glycosyltransferase family 2 protein [Gluconobacter cerinus]MBS1045672.1 glycosyltransferase family 2 protein [Gluconobacter cerinus]